MLEQSYVDELRHLGLHHGLDAVGVAPATPMTEARQAIEARIAAGQHDTMAFTFKNPARSTEPGRAVRGAQALVVGARSYLGPDPPRPAGPQGRVARYARGDQYAPLRDALGAVAHRLRADGWKAVVFADDNSLVDRAAAHRAGLGWFGKNANLLLPGRGSWFVLGSVVTDAPLPTAEQPAPDGCGACRRCLDGCPTGAIVEPGVVDGRRCLAWLVQKRGVFPRQHRVALGDRIYGCDDCQEVCPPSVRSGRDPSPAAGAGDTTWVSLTGLLGATDDEILERHGRWYIAGRQVRWIRRNALVALGNVGDGTDPPVVAALRAHLTHPDALLRAHAVWAAARLGRADLLGLVAGDPPNEVADELAHLPAARPPG